MNISLPEKNLLLFSKSIAGMDQIYNEKEALIGAGGKLDVRGSAEYALALLARGEGGDIARAIKTIERVLEMQLLYPGEVFHATFKRDPREPDPKAINMPLDVITPQARYLYDLYNETAVNKLVSGLIEDGADINEALALEKRLEDAQNKSFPVIWRTYDPNWREFIGCSFALILELYEQDLPAELVKKMDAAMLETTRASIDRQMRKIHPMNTNIELMHIVICDYYGERFADKEIIAHGEYIAKDFYKRYTEFHSVAEFNSPTYNAVDFCALAQWRRFGKNAAVKNLGELIEQGLWEDVALFYNPALDNISGPFTRNYEMNMSLHTSMHALLFVGLPEYDGRPLPQRCEGAHNATIAICSPVIPQHLKSAFIEFKENRNIVKQFRELIERGEPAYNNPLCTATAVIEKYFMIGGLAGSKNVSGQIHPATAYWAHEGKVYSIRLLRREVGNAFGKGNRSVHYNAGVEKRDMHIDIEIDIERDIEIFFEIEGENLSVDMITDKLWKLPGLDIEIAAKAPAVTAFKTADNRIEAVYTSKFSRPNQKRSMSFEMHYNPTC